MQSEQPGEIFDASPLIPQADLRGINMRVSTDRYRSPEYQRRERELLWMKVWQIAGRADELTEAGDWLEYRIFDQSFLLVRGREGQIRGFVNACRHRGNALCDGKGRAARFTCPYHNWSYGLDGQLLAVAKPDYDGPVEEFVGDKRDLGLIEVPVECFAGFIFITPDRGAMPLRDFLGEAYDVLAAYRMEEMIPVDLNVREPIRCNWKVVMDAFYEGYHVQAVHPELIPMVDLTKERFVRFGRHAATTVPFGGPGQVGTSEESEVEMIRNLPPLNFPGLVEVLPRFEAKVAAHIAADGALSLPAGVTARGLMQQAAREDLTDRGMDVGALTDGQMSDYQFWAIFPNVYIQLRAGEATVIIAEPDGEGDPNRCFWRVAHYMWLPTEQREARRTPMTDIPDGEHVPYFLALEQDYEQMEHQQKGLRNSALASLALTRQEPKVANFHTALDAWLEGAAA
jgi:phenylpropionate dioxygenase-like ring-hydroxylating dioxygenase large terminal subunit